ncbi:hypothetical protein RI056_17470 [Komagataeibacter nataicola]|uniref:hypothetical protein n=1 Tax=Komagataeibacter nataicola TaxID=265960 RepID=UPI0028A72F4E|nr:hypothetical protein [Komagataeibacter nataicola]WNM08588.1 hypothetical protein RI056_17470 [Komagataeibacter nataicola]
MTSPGTIILAAMAAMAFFSRMARRLRYSMLLSAMPLGRAVTPPCTRRSNPCADSACRSRWMVMRLVANRVTSSSISTLPRFMT